MSVRVKAKDIHEACRLTFNTIMDLRHARANLIIASRLRWYRRLRWLIDEPTDLEWRAIRLDLLKSHSWVRAYPDQMWKVEALMAAAEAVLRQSEAGRMTLEIEDFYCIEVGWAKMVTMANERGYKGDEFRYASMSRPDARKSGPEPLLKQGPPILRKAGGPSEDEDE